jgi:putative peptidoglycan binding protein
MAEPNLSVGFFGNDVANLHKALARAGIDVLASEAAREFFGPITRQAVCEYQKATRAGSKWRGGQENRCSARDHNAKQLCSSGFRRGKLTPWRHCGCRTHWLEGAKCRAKRHDLSWRCMTCRISSSPEARFFPPAVLPIRP